MTTVPLRRVSKVVGYTRVSTEEQDLSKQRETIEFYANRNNLKITKFVNVSSTKELNSRELVS